MLFSDSRVSLAEMMKDLFETAFSRTIVWEASSKEMLIIINKHFGGVGGGVS